MNRYAHPSVSRSSERRLSAAAWVVTSRALVGSSQMMSLGLRATARAMAMRRR